MTLKRHQEAVSLYLVVNLCLDNKEFSKTERFKSVRRWKRGNTLHALSKCVFFSDLAAMLLLETLSDLRYLVLKSENDV